MRIDRRGCILGVSVFLIVGLLVSSSPVLANSFVLPKQDVNKVTAPQNQKTKTKGKAVKVMPSNPQRDNQRPSLGKKLLQSSLLSTQTVTTAVTDATPPSA